MPSPKLPANRCINIDWLEVYCLESNDRYPCNADYFRSRGYFVHEREYGTRQYNQMFTIDDEHGLPWIEVRRDPASGQSSFAGFVPQSCHLRLTNRACYEDNAVAKFRDFLLQHDYIFKRIFRIDICHDFEFFDSGDRPDKFLRRYIEGKFAKINQCRVSAHGADNWAQFDWESISWGARSSMVSTKMYNKTLELKSVSKEKTYIPYCWWVNGLIDDPINMTRVNSNGAVYSPTIWRVEFSLKSSADNWIVIDDTSGKRTKKKAVPHRLEMFDARDKLWQRFEDLAYHYFRFKHYEAGRRKDRCEDKVLYVFNAGKVFHKVGQLPAPAKIERDDDLIRRRLIAYRSTHSNPDVRTACDVILRYIDTNIARTLTPHNHYIEARALQEAIALKMRGDKRTALEIIEEVKKLLANDLIF